MLEVEKVTLAAAEAGLQLVKGLGVRHGDLVQQFQRAVLSQALNTSEGLARGGGDRRHLLTVARASSNEASVALKLLAALGTVDGGKALAVEAMLDRGRAMLWRLAR